MTDPAATPDSPSHGALVLPEFTPVPREKDRSNGWKPAVQHAFIEALAETGSVKAACARVNRAEVGAYLLRRHPQAQEFRRAWDAALDIGMRRIEDVAMDRALHGHEQPVYSYGKLVGTRTVFNDRLLMFMLRNRAPERFAGGKAQALSALDQAALKQLKAQWRSEWEREQANEAAAADRGSGNRLVQGIIARHFQWWSGLTPRARAAYLEFRRLESEDARLARAAPSAEEDQAARADYLESFAHDNRSRMDLLIEADGLADETVLGDDLPDPSPGRTLSIKDGSWSFLDPARNDGRATPL
jgi:hypothetical protein